VQTVPQIPVLYSALITLILLSAYTGMTVALIIPVLFVTFAVFRFCGFCNRTDPRKYYIRGLLAVLIPTFCLIFFPSYDVPILMWLFSPVPGTGYTAYLLFVFIFGGFFIPSAVYYFTSVVYRAPVLLLLLLISYVANYRRIADVPAGFAVLAAGLFFAVMALHGNAELKKTVWLAQSRYIVSFACAVCVAALLASMISVPAKEPPEGDFNTSSSAFPLMGNSRFSGNTGNSALSDRVLFLVEAEEPIYFIRQVFGRYNGERWEYPEDGSLNAGPYAWKDRAASRNLDRLLENAEEIRTAVVRPQNFPARYIIAPVRTFDVRDLPPDVREIRNKMDEIFITDWKTVDSDYTITYYSEGIHRSRELQDLVRPFAHRSQEALEYAEFVRDDPIERLQRLAEGITADSESPYEKAKALERYFSDNGYSYNLRFDPANNNIEHFLSEGKTGTCGHYATAMTLMARSIGLNARYVEGFVSTELNEEGQYVIREKNSHAFVQVYIPVYGWATFDPTVAADETPDGWLTEAVNQMLGGDATVIFAALSALVVTGLLVRGIYFFVLKERIFLRKVRKRRDGIVLLYRRLTGLARTKFGAENIPGTALARLIYDAYRVDAGVIVNCYERTVFNNETVSQQEKEEALAVYRLLRSTNSNVVSYRFANSGSRIASQTKG
jgi:hypothetical protein